MNLGLPKEKKSPQVFSLFLVTTCKQKYNGINHFSILEQGSLKEIRHEHEQVLSAWVKDQNTLQELKTRYNATNFKVKLIVEL